MNKLFTKIATLSVGLAMAIGVGVAVGGSNRAAKAEASDTSYTFSDHYSSNTTLDGTSVSLDSFTTATFSKRQGGTATQYYTNGYAVRWYGGGGLEISSSKTLSEIVITFTQTANSISSNVGTYSSGTWTGSASSVTFSQSGTTGHCRISTIELTYESGSSKTIQANSVTIKSGSATISGTFEPSGTYYSDDTLDLTSSVVTYQTGSDYEDGDGVINWSSSNTSVATVSAGVVTYISAGTTTITATAADKGANNSTVSASFVLDISNISYHPGSVGDPYTVAEALAASAATGKYAKGIVCAVGTYNSTYHNLVYDIGDVIGSETLIRVYRGKYFDGGNFTNDNLLQVGDEVVVCGEIVVYQEVNQFAQDTKVVSLKRLTGITISTAPTKVNYEAGESFDPTGIVVNASFTDGTNTTQENVTSSISYSSDELTVSDTSVTISYTWNGVTKTASQDILVIDSTPFITLSDNTLSGVTDETKELTVNYGNLSGSLSVSRVGTSASASIKTAIANRTVYTISLDSAGETTFTFYDSGDNSLSASCTVSVAEAPGELEITYSSYSSNLPASGYGAVDWASDDIEGKIYSITNSNSAIQFQANNSYIYNTVAIAGYITSITIEKYSGSYSQLTAFVTDSEGGAIESKPESGGTTNNSNWTWEFNSSSHYCYFRIDSTSSGAKYFSSITVTYEKVAKVNPTGIHLNDNSAISMDTYGYGRRRLSATVEPFNNNDGTINWGTSDSSVVTVSNGVLTAVGTGTTTVYATTGNYVSDVATPALKASVSVTVTQALYKKATFKPTSTTSAVEEDDCLESGSVVVKNGGATFNNDKSAIQLSGNNGTQTSTFTISGYKGMKITGIDLIMSSNGNSGSGSLTVTAGSTKVLEIESTTFSSEAWNGAYDANPCDIYESITPYVVDNNEDIVFSFAGTVNSIYIHSVSIRYLDYSLEQWCEKFLNQITCSGATQENPDGSITNDSNWDSLGIEFLDLDPELIEIAAKATADKDSSSVIEQAMARYDLIIRKYGTSAHDDFIGRFGTGTINGPLNPAMAFFSENSNNATTAIVIISLVSVTAIGGYFFLRKKKER